VRRLRVAVVGAGNIARQHLPVLTHHPLCEVALLCDADPAALAGTADRFGIAGRGAGVADVLRRDDVDAAFVLVSHRATAEVAGACLAAGLPAMIEKPPGMFSAHTARLVELQARHGTIAQVGLNRRFYASHLAARAAVAAAGPLATLTVEAHEDLSRMTTGRFRPEEVALMRRRRPYANGIHALDLIRYFGGEVETVEVRRRAAAHDFPDGYAAILGLASGALGRVAMDFLGPGSHRFELRTATATVTSDAPFLGATLRRRDQPAERLEPDDDDRRYKPGFWKQDTTFLEAVHAGRQPPFPAPSLADAYETMRLIDRLFGGAE
jgi:predicted dehydrogenase